MYVSQILHMEGFDGKPYGLHPPHSGHHCGDHYGKKVATSKFSELILLTKRVLHRAALSKLHSVRSLGTSAVFHTRMLKFGLSSNAEVPCSKFEVSRINLFRRRNKLPTMSHSDKKLFTPVSLCH